ncbi:glycine--tRNA ligase [Candidatus Micrarchaeota archaeon]|nr:glycine--tRNA ligase [Candidatus Micrarchaeota archaeon]MBD3417654.1 glycine--tRNA ligase [Candidatus Micrarchaeota archaeon]
MELHERIFELALNRSIFMPSNEVYGSVSGFYDYGPIGFQIKRNLEELWRRRFLVEEGFLEIQSTIVTPEIVLKASGHVEEFTDPVVSCNKCGVKVRADHLVERALNVKWDMKLESIDKLIRDNGIKCPSCKEGELSDAYNTNLMFETGIGADSSPAFLRPETAQGIFTSFQRVFRNSGSKLPMAVGQIGRSFRNEISPRKGLVRMREFTQMELEYFFNPSKPEIEGFDGTKEKKMRMLKRGAKKPEWITASQVVEEGIGNQIMAYFLAKEWEYYVDAGLDPEKMWFRHLGEDETPHYSKSNVDLEVETSYGVVEISGNAYRTDYDLSQHKKFSGEGLEVFVQEEGKKILPHVFEVSMGTDRMIFCLLEHAFRDKSEGKEWEWFDLPPAVAPYEVAVFPLMKKPELKIPAKEIASGLREAGLNTQFSHVGSIGKRYARADEAGIPYCITIDYQTLEDDTVTVRFRNDGQQERIKKDELAAKIKEYKKEGKFTL